jgi:transcriptional regulator with XRE-family HTH domain
MSHSRERNILFGKLIARYIENSKEKQRDIAERLDIGERELRQIKSGQVPIESTRTRLRDGLVVSAAEMAGALETGAEEDLKEVFQWHRTNHHQWHRTNHQRINRIW